MLHIQEISVPGYERVIEAIDSDSKLHAFIAIHSTKLGPSLGGTRIYPYASREDALQDALRLSSAMSYKSALLNNGLGGGKSVIIADPKKAKTESLLLSFAEVINYLKGAYIAAEDVGSTTDDMLIIRKKTPYVAALPVEQSSGDPSRFTAWGIVQGMHAIAQFLWKNPSLKNKKIGIQGLGSVGSKLATFLFWEGADLYVHDLDPFKEDLLHKNLGAQILSNDELFSYPLDILAPCALGGIINEQTIPLLKTKAIAGSANNQLLTKEDGIRLKECHILYAPDFVINAGGIINASLEFTKAGYNPKKAREQVSGIYFLLQQILEKAQKLNKSPHEVADEMAELNLRR